MFNKVFEAEKAKLKAINSTMYRFNPLNLQLFADDDGDDGGEDDDDGDDDDPETYTKEEVEQMIKQARDNAWKESEKKFKGKLARQREESEAERLKKMTAEEKRDHEFEELKKQLADFKRERAMGEMTKEARSILRDEGVNVSDGIISRLVGEDADSTKENVEEFVKAYKADVAKAVQEALKGRTPRTDGKGGAKKLTKEQLEEKMKGLGRSERLKLIRENMDLFK